MLQDWMHFDIDKTNNEIILTFNVWLIFMSHLRLVISLLSGKPKQLLFKDKKTYSLCSSTRVSFVSV